MLLALSVILLSAPVENPLLYIRSYDLSTHNAAERPTQMELEPDTSNVKTHTANSAHWAISRCAAQNKLRLAQGKTRR